MTPQSLVDTQIADIERKRAVMAYGIPFNELIGLPRDTLVRELSKQLSMIQKGRRIAVRVRG